MSDIYSAQKPVMLDLFSGMKGASAAMKERGWTVITVDNNSNLNPDIIVDISEYHYEGPTPDLIWASPPCTEFSKASLPKSWACNRTPPNPDVSLMLHAKRIIDEINPTWWVIENVRGAVPYFTPYLGEYQKKCGSRYLWGNFPIFDPEPGYGKWRLPPTADRAAIRSLIPSQISRGLCLAIAQNREARE